MLPCTSRHGNRRTLIRWTLKACPSTSAGIAVHRPGVEAPSVVAALHFRAVEGAVVQRNAAMRTDIEQAENFAATGAAEQQRLAEQHLGQHLPAPEPMPWHGEVPKSGEEKPRAVGIGQQRRERLIHALL
jgi:hypothetical protein